MIMTEQLGAVRRLTAASAGAMGVLMITLFSPIARIVAHFHVSTSVASAVVGLVTSGAIWAISVFYPWLIPVLTTVRALIAIGGAGLAIGW